MGLSIFRRRPPPAIDELLWRSTLADYPFVVRIGPQRLARLRDMAAEFLRHKAFAGAAGQTVDDRIGLAIAVQACLPVLELGLRWYNGFQQIVVYPDQFRVQRRETDDSGVVHEWSDVLAGETIDGGPVVLSWADAAPADEPEADPDWNVVIHEFIHKIDLRDGEADGMPPLPAARRQAWRRAIDGAFDHFVAMLERVERRIPRHVDPEGPEAERYYGSLPLDPYAGHDIGEFFAVSGEAFFLDSRRLREFFPAYHAELVGFFGYDPGAAA